MRSAADRPLPVLGEDLARRDVNAVPRQSEAQLCGRARAVGWNENRSRETGAALGSSVMPVGYHLTGCESTRWMVLNGGSTDLLSLTALSTFADCPVYLHWLPCLPSLTALSTFADCPVYLHAVIAAFLFFLVHLLTSGTKIITT